MNQQSLRDEFRKVVEDCEKFAYELGNADTDDEVSDQVWHTTKENLAAARSRLLELWNGREEENERLRGECSGWHDLTENAEGRVEYWRAEAERLRASVLTERELHVFVYLLADRGVLLPGLRTEERKALSEKFRRRLAGETANG